jgi:hypothetical protein
MYNVVFTMIACLCYLILKSDKQKLKLCTWIIYSLLLIISVYLFSSVVILRIQTPEIWDFSAFYLYGKVAAGGYNFYKPENFHVVFNAINMPFTDFFGFIEEVVDVGFPYPPQTMLYFLPLGFLSYDNALICWTLFNLLFVIGSIYLIYTLFLLPDKLNGLMLVLILFLVSAQVRSTVSFSQTNFILLFFLLLMKKYSNRGFVGIILAFAIFTKPYMLIFGLFFLLIRNWKAIYYFTFSSAFLTGLTIIIIGKETFLGYFTNNATQRMPKWQFSEPINQSLHAVLLRANLISLDKPLTYLFIAMALFAVVLALVVYLLKKKNYDFIWALLLLIGLLIYPGTLSYYGTLLLFITFQFFHKEQPLALHSYLIIPVIGLFNYLNIASVFASICFLLIIVIYQSLQSDLKLILPTLISRNNKISQ